MNNEFNKIRKGVQSIQLSETEKSLMKSAIMSGVVLSPYSTVTNVDPVRYKYQWNIGEFTNSLFKHKNYMTALILALMLAVGGGSSAMAEKAIPGDALYQMKVSVNEPIVGMFTLSKEGNTAWQEKLVERRLDEAQKVVAEGTLSTSTQAEIEANVHAQVDKFTAAAKDLSEDKNKEVISSELAVRLEAVLKAHQDILVQAQANGSVKASTRENAKDLLAAFKEDESKVRGHREEAELDLGEEDNNANASTTTKVAAENKQAVAKKILDNVKNVYQDEKSGLATSSKITVEAEILAADKVLAAGAVDLASANYANARDKFQTVIQSANDIRVTVLTGSIKSDLEIDVKNNQEDRDKKNEGETKNVKQSENNEKSDEKKSTSTSTKKSENTEGQKESSDENKSDDNKNESDISSQKLNTEASLKIDAGQKVEGEEGDEKVEVNTNLKINN